LGHVVFLLINVMGLPSSYNLMYACSYYSMHLTLIRDWVIRAIIRRWIHKYQNAIHLP